MPVVGFMDFFAATILTVVLVGGWYINGGDVTYGRLIGDPPQHNFSNPCLLRTKRYTRFWLGLFTPPIVLLIITRYGIPVSTSFLILTFFNEKNLENMVIKSISGYLVAFGAATALYLATARRLERYFIENPATKKQKQVWTVLSMGFNWFFMVSMVDSRLC